MQRLLQILKRKRPRQRELPPTPPSQLSPENVSILLQGTSIVMAAERVLWTTRRFRAELEELIALARELPLLDSSEVKEAQLGDTRAVIFQLCEIEGQFGPGFDEVEASARERIKAIIAMVKAQPPWCVPFVLC